jgi:CDP-diacylglycerol--serine O-phosphatidyltransferase
MPEPITRPYRRRSALSFVYDRANLLTLAGLVCGILAIWFSVRGAYAEASTALLWALFCDWFDGPLARRMTGRTDQDRAFGAQLDSLTDIVSSGVAPAMLLVSIGDFEPWFLPGAFLLVVAGAIRLAHFNIGGNGDGAYSGLPIDSNIIVVTALFPFRELLGHVTFSWALYLAVVTLAILNVAPFRMPKLVGGWYYIIAIYVIAMTALNLSSITR